MGFVHLSSRDAYVLEKIKDPEAAPSAGIIIDPSMPKDPYIDDSATYDRVAQQEKDIILSIRNIETQLAGLRQKGSEDVMEDYRQCISRLDGLIIDQPNYASARNNRAQALRRMYGDTMLLFGVPSPQALRQEVKPIERIAAAVKVLSDLDKSIDLLTPQTPLSGLSPHSVRTLSMAHTQRAAIFHMTAKFWTVGPLSVDSERREAKWNERDFEEAASRDFALGGRYGNDIAKALAVSTNPTARLCGQIVSEAIWKEYGADFPDSG